MVGRHADVDERDVGAARVDHAQERVGVAAAAGDLDPGVLEQPGESVAEQRFVVGDHDAHGSSAWRRPASAARVAAGGDAVLDASGAGGGAARVDVELVVEGACLDCELPWRSVSATRK